MEREQQLQLVAVRGDHQRYMDLLQLDKEDAEFSEEVEVLVHLDVGCKHVPIHPSYAAEHAAECERMLQLWSHWTLRF